MSSRGPARPARISSQVMLRGAVEFMSFLVSWPAACPGGFHFLGEIGDLAVQHAHFLLRLDREARIGAGIGHLRNSAGALARCSRRLWSSWARVLMVWRG